MRLRTSPTEPGSRSARAMRAILAGGSVAPVRADPPVPDTRFGEDQRGCPGNLLQLLAEVRHVDAQVVALVRVALAPHLLQQPALGEQLAGVADEQVEQGELGGREVDRLAALQY